jgi:cell division protein FtsQ
MTYLRAATWIVVGLAGAWGAYASGNFLYASRQMALIHPEQVTIRGMDGAPLRYVPQARILEVFAADRGRSVLRVPLDARRQQLEAIPWVEQASVRRALPNRVQVEILERTPIAFLRQASELSLVDVHGVILERPTKGAFHFPVVAGISREMAQEDRERRMQLYAGFAQQIEAARSGALEKVSEVDLADVNDLRANLTGLAGGAAGPAVTGVAPSPSPSFVGGAWSPADAPLVVHFGDSDFETKYRNLVENIGQWRATAGRVDSVDMRFSREAVVNPEPAPLGRPAPKVTPAPPARPKLTSAQNASPAQKTSEVGKKRMARKTTFARHPAPAPKSSTTKKAASKPGHPAVKPGT